MTHVLLVEDSRITRKALETCIALSEDFTLTASIENAANAEIICMGKRVDLILMDVCTADGESGLKAAESIRRHYPKIKIIVMTSVPEYSFSDKAKKIGCEGFWYKEDETEDILSVCSRVMAGETVRPQNTPVVRIGNAVTTDFTERETDVMKALTEGLSQKEIAAKLCISENTLKYHVKNLLQKTGFPDTRTLALEIAFSQWIIPKY